MTTENLQGFANLELQLGKIVKISKLSLRIPCKSLKSEKKSMNTYAHEVLKAEHIEQVFHLILF